MTGEALGFAYTLAGWLGRVVRHDLTPYWLVVLAALLLGGCSDDSRIERECRAMLSVAATKADSMVVFTEANHAHDCAEMVGAEL